MPAPAALARLALPSQARAHLARSALSKPVTLCHTVPVYILPVCP